MAGALDGARANGQAGARAARAGAADIRESLSMRVSVLLAAAALAAAPLAHAAAPAAGPGKMKTCAGEWKAMSAADKAKYDDKAKGMKSKKGGKVSGYNAWTGECMKK